MFNEAKETNNEDFVYVPDIKCLLKLKPFGGLGGVEELSL